MTISNNNDLITKSENSLKLFSPSGSAKNDNKISTLIIDHLLMHGERIKSNFLLKVKTLSFLSSNEFHLCCGQNVRSIFEKILAKTGLDFLKEKQISLLNHPFCVKAACLNFSSRELPKDKDREIYELDLVIACAQGDLEKVRSMTAGALGTLDYTLLVISADNGKKNVLKYLIEECNMDPQGTANSVTPLHAACVNGNLEIIQYLIEDCKIVIPQVTTINGLKFNLLAPPCSDGHLEATKYLIEKCKLDPREPTAEGFSLVYKTCENGHLELTKYLIEVCKLDPRKSTAKSSSPLYIACQNGHLEIVKYLIKDCGLDPAEKKADGSTLLFRACASGHLEIVKYLIENCKLDPKETANGWNLLNFACCQNNLGVIKYLIENCGLNPKEAAANGWTSLGSACKHAPLETVKYMFENYGLDPAEKVNGFTLLHVACETGRLETIKYLIENRKVSPRELTAGGLTPLHVACQNGHLQVVEYLIENCKLDPTEKASDWTPLYTACLNGQLEVANYLIETCKVNPREPTAKGWTPLHAACLSGSVKVVKHLIENCKLDPTERANDWTSLYTACHNGHLEVTKCLIEDCKVDPDEKNTMGLTPLYVACRNGHLPVAKYLFENCKMDIKLTNNNGLTFTPLYVACENGHLPIAKYLIENCKMDPKEKTNLGDIALHVATIHPHANVIAYLIECDPRMLFLKNLKATSPLSYLVSKKSPLVTSILQEHLQSIEKFCETPPKEISEYLKLVSLHDAFISEFSRIQCAEEHQLCVEKSPLFTCWLVPKPLQLALQERIASLTTGSNELSQLTKSLEEAKELRPQFESLKRLCELTFKTTNPTKFISDLCENLSQLIQTLHAKIETIKDANLADFQKKYLEEDVFTLLSELGLGVGSSEHNMNPEDSYFNYLGRGSEAIYSFGIVEGRDLTAIGVDCLISFWTNKLEKAEQKEETLMQLCKCLQEKLQTYSSLPTSFQDEIREQAGALQKIHAVLLRGIPEDLTQLLSDLRNQDRILKRTLLRCYLSQDDKTVKEVFATHSCSSLSELQKEKNLTLAQLFRLGDTLKRARS